MATRRRSGSATPAPTAASLLAALAQSITATGLCGAPMIFGCWVVLVIFGVVIGRGVDAALAGARGTPERSWGVGRARIGGVRVVLGVM